VATWLVTGGAGFIGCNFVRLALAKTDARVVVFDKLTYAGNPASLADVRDHPRFAFVQADIADRAAVEDAYRTHRPDAVLNFAAETHVDRSIDGPAEFVRTNVVGTFELLEAARGHLAERDAADREAFRFLHVSTDEVYGSLGETGAFHEATPYEPNSPYSASKAGADHLVRAYHETYGLPALITNCSNNYGPYQYPEKLIPLLITNLIDGLQIPIYGDGRNVRDWLHVEDHCRGILLALEKGRAGETYNIGGRNERRNLDIAHGILKLMGRDASSIRYVEDRLGHDRRYAIDADKIRNELGWEPRHTFDTGLPATVEWYKANESWWRPLKRS
jgi:dTDP-glucose 4,6-dehydratase